MSIWHVPLLLEALIPIKNLSNRSKVMWCLARALSKVTPKA